MVRVGEHRIVAQHRFVSAHRIHAAPHVLEQHRQVVVEQRIVAERGQRLAVHAFGLRMLARLVQQSAEIDARVQPFGLRADRESLTAELWPDIREQNVYAKLPGWFTVPTPLGSYNPDWAVLVEKDGEERLYFVVETKGGLFADDLRDKERAKIECGKAHFKALAVGEKNPAEFVQARNLDDVMAKS